MGITNSLAVILAMQRAKSKAEENRTRDCGMAGMAQAQRIASFLLDKGYLCRYSG
jgi:hypothetical protein